MYYVYNMYIMYYIYILCILYICIIYVCALYTYVHFFKYNYIPPDLGLQLLSPKLNKVQLGPSCRP